MAECVLVVGATGHIGRHFVHALRSDGRDVLMLVRPNPTNDPAQGDRRAVIDSLVRQGAKILEGSLEDLRVLERACADADAIVSCVDHRPDHLKLQSTLAKIASKFGRVKRILPSQFGMDSRVYAPGRVDHGDTKRMLQREFDDCGVPVTYVHINGLATAWAAGLGQLGLKQPPHEQIDVYGAGNVKFSIVSPKDVARHAARALFDPRTANRHTLISPPQNRLTQGELIDMWEALTGARLRRHMISAGELDERIAAASDQPDKLATLGFLQLIRAAWIDGLGDGRRRADVLELTELYPDIGYETIPQYLRQFTLAEAAE